MLPHHKLSCITSTEFQTKYRRVVTISFPFILYVILFWRKINFLLTEWKQGRKVSSPSCFYFILKPKKRSSSFFLGNGNFFYFGKYKIVVYRKYVKNVITSQLGTLRLVYVKFTKVLTNWVNDRIFAQVSDFVFKICVLNR